MDAKFTPGPWATIRDNHFRVEQDDTGYTSWIALGPEGGLTVALAVTDGDCEDSEVEANAHLIAAAPRMYAALQQAELCCEELCRGQHPYNQCWVVLKEVQDAMAEARGEQVP